MACLNIARLLLICALSFSLPAYAREAKADSGTIESDPHEVRALELARLLNSQAIIIGDEKDDEAATQLMIDLFGSKEATAEIESEYPGITREMAGAILPIINDSFRQRLPQLHQRQAGLYKRNFSLRELDTLVEFYGSPTGAKMIDVMQANMKPRAIMEEAKKSDDFEISSTAVLSDIKDTVPNILEAFTEEDNLKLQILAQAGVLPKMKQIAPETQTIVLKWMDESLPGEEAAIDKAIKSVMNKRGFKFD